MLDAVSSFLKAANLADDVRDLRKNAKWKMDELQWRAAIGGYPQRERVRSIRHARKKMRGPVRTGCGRPTDEATVAISRRAIATATAAFYSSSSSFSSAEPSNRVEGWLRVCHDPSGPTRCNYEQYS